MQVEGGLRPRRLAEHHRQRGGGVDDIGRGDGINRLADAVAIAVVGVASGRHPIRQEPSADLTHNFEQILRNPSKPEGSFLLGRRPIAYAIGLPGPYPNRCTGAGVPRISGLQLLRPFGIFSIPSLQPRAVASSRSCQRHRFR